MLPRQVRADLYETKPISKLPLGLQDDLIVTFEEVLKRHFDFTLKVGDADVSDNSTTLHAE